jgi:hypothetical protein
MTVPVEASCRTVYPRFVHLDGVEELAVDRLKCDVGSYVVGRCGIPVSVKPYQARTYQRGLVEQRDRSLPSWLPRVSRLPMQTPGAAGRRSSARSLRLRRGAVPVPRSPARRCLSGGAPEGFYWPCRQGARGRSRRRRGSGRYRASVLARVGTAAAFASGFAVGALVRSAAVHRGGRPTAPEWAPPARSSSARFTVTCRPHGWPRRFLLVLAVPDGAPHGSIVRLSRIDLQKSMTAHRGTRRRDLHGGGRVEAIAPEVGSPRSSPGTSGMRRRARGDQAVAFSPSSGKDRASGGRVSEGRRRSAAPARRASGLGAWIDHRAPPRPSSKPNLHPNPTTDDEGNASEASREAAGKRSRQRTARQGPRQQRRERSEPRSGGGAVAPGPPGRPP